MESPATPRPSPRGFRKYAYQCLAVLVAVSASLALHTFRELAQLRTELKETQSQSERRFQGFRSRVQFDSERRRLLLGITDAILRTRPEVGPRIADELATWCSKAREIPRVDPLLLVAVGIVKRIRRRGDLPRGRLEGSPDLPTGRVLAPARLGVPRGVVARPGESTEMAATI
jgi:hypothetical protein